MKPTDYNKLHLGCYECCRDTLVFRQLYTTFWQGWRSNNSNATDQNTKPKIQNQKLHIHNCSKSINMICVPRKNIVTVVLATRLPFGKSTLLFGRAAPPTTLTTMTKIQKPRTRSPKMSQIQNQPPKIHMKLTQHIKSNDNT